jgi:choline dehydrogenase-like flavoprotein
VLIDARKIPQDQVIESDICIIGGGAAGITMALQFIGKSYKVCVLESGGLEDDANTQKLAEGKNIGYEFLPIVRQCIRKVGGNTNLWGSWCRPLDELDFEKRDWVPHSGWPISKKDLDPFYERAHVVCRLRDYNYDAEYVMQNAKGDPLFQPIPLKSDKIENKFWQFHKPPIRFGTDKEHKANLEAAKNVEVYIHANAIDIETNDAGKEATRVRVACLNGSQFWVKSRFFVLAMGGLENPRLMLASNKQQVAGLGNQNDLVGRYFMEHPHLHRSGLFLIPSMESYPALYTPESQQTYEITAGFCPTRQFQEQQKILNFSATMDPTVKYWPNSTFADGYLNHLTAAIADLSNIDSKIARQVNSKMGWKLPKEPRGILLDLTTRSEQAPNPDSRITLANEKDAVGLNRIQLDWRLQSIDKRTIYTVHRAIGEAIGQSNVGRFKIDINNDYGKDGDPWNPATESSGYIGGGFHHLGTTRMHTDPKQGVVDINCQVHGMGNLYVAGSSVFTTGGFANPTLTIIALALRLTDRLDAQLRPGAVQLKAEPTPKATPKATPQTPAKPKP